MVEKLPHGHGETMGELLIGKAEHNGRNEQRESWKNGEEDMQKMWGYLEGGEGIMKFGKTRCYLI